MAAQNYTLGRGRVYFSRFLPGTQTPAGYEYIGNTPEFSLTIESETLDHYSSDEGIREKDDSVPLQVNRTGALTTDNVSPANIALFFFGSEEIVTTVAAASQTDTISDVRKGRIYQIGQTASNPVGARGIDTVAVKNGATTYVAGTDYTVNLDTGMLEILPTGAIPADTDLTITYGVRASTRPRIISGSEPVEGAMKYIAHNPKGADFDYTLPWVKVTPNGDYALKGDEWQTIPFNLEALKPVGLEAIYVDGRPAFSA
jgi:hypothetical protein